MSFPTRSFLAFAVSGLLASACVSDFDVAGPEQTLWTADLMPDLEYPMVSGTGAAVSGSTLTEAGITMTGLDPGIYAWRIREGRCDDPGEVFGGEGQYPDLVVEEPGEPDPDEEDENGPPSASAQTAPFRGVMARGAEYQVDVRTTDSGDRVACGNFIRG